MSDDGDFILSVQDNFALSYEDRKNMVLSLYRQGKRRREIAKTARMSFTDIKKIVDAEFGPTEEKKNAKNTELSPFSHALELFLSGAKPVTVSIKLSLSYEQVWKIYVQFLNLNRMHRLRKIYEELGDNNIKPFLAMYNEIQDNNFTPEQVTDAVKYVSSLPQLQERYQALETKTASLELKREELTVSDTMLKNQVDEAKRDLEYFRCESEKKKNEILQLTNEANARKNFIQNFDNEQGFSR